jgi:hypothetical protein
MITPRLNARVTLTSGHVVYFLGLLPDQRMRVQSVRLGIQFETCLSRLPYLL